MMDVPLTTWLLFSGAARHHHRSEVVSRLPSGEIHRYNFGGFSGRTQQLMGAIDSLGIGEGERVATLAWNSYRHLEAYFAVPCAGRVLHTLNVRLAAEELASVMNDADDRAVLVDPDFLHYLEQVAPEVPGLRHVVVLGDGSSATSLPGAVSYEALIEPEAPHYDRPVIDERSPCGLCYTSGTTGRPKGVVYSHRSTYLQALGASSMAGMAIGPGDCVLPQVPMFHVNAWGMLHAGVGVGAKLVFFAGALEPGPFAELLVDERVTISAGVPTVWIAVADELALRTERTERTERTQRTELVAGTERTLGQCTLALRHIVSGGSQPPRALIERYARDFGVPIVQAWGMTETSPLASVAWPAERMRDGDDDDVTTAARTQAGFPIPGVEISIRDPDGDEVAFDGATMGAVHVRGPWVTDGYLHGHGADSFTKDGWFNTGDVAVGNPDGYFVIADRTKDLIKSGGEWISSVDMEAAIMAMPGVIEAAVVAVPDPKWVERPLACVVAAEGTVLTARRLCSPTWRATASPGGSSPIGSRSSTRSRRPRSANSTRSCCGSASRRDSVTSADE